MPTWTHSNADDKTADPYLEWTRLTGWQGHAAARQPASRVPVLLELKTAEPPANIDRLAIVSSGLLEVPGIYRSRKLAGLKYLSGFIARNRLDELALSNEVERFEFSLPVDAGAPDQIEAQAGPAEGVVIGVIDRGCAFLNGVFRRAWAGPGRQQTRITAFWDQTQRPNGPYWKAPGAAGYGRELAADDINRLIARQLAGESEESLYRELQHPIDADGRVTDRVHGTHVLDTAAGLVPPFAQVSSAKPDEPDAAQGCNMIFVNLPTLADGDTTGASTNAYILDGIHYILHRAGPKARVVINLSVGNQGGPHDGSSLLDRAMDELLASLPTKLAITVAAGNAAEERWSMTGSASPQSTARFSWRLMPQDTTDSFLEIWLKTQGAVNLPGLAMALRIVPPVGPLCDLDFVNSKTALFEDEAGRPICRVSFRGSPALGDGPMILVSMAPTAGPRGTAMAGAWRFELSGSQVGVDFDAWIQGDAPPYGSDDPVQSRFDDLPGNLAGAGNSLNGLACGSRVIAVGASRLSDLQESSYSSRQSAAAPSRTRSKDVQLLAPADENATGIGLFCAGVLTGTVFRTGGTSIAAPRAARYIAGLMINAPAQVPPPGGQAPPPTDYVSELSKLPLMSKPGRP